MAASMEQLERTVVQLAEAERLADFDDVPRGRLALLLLDNAIETSLARTAKHHLLFAEMYADMAYVLRDVDPEDVEGQELKSSIAAKTLSKRKQKQVERNFDDLVDYVVGLDDQMDIGVGECFKIIHRFRNAAYHRDEVRPDILGPAVQIAFYLACLALKSERQLLREIADVPESIMHIFGSEPPAFSWHGMGSDTESLGRAVANHLLERRGLDHAKVAKALSQHLEGRLRALDRDLDRIGQQPPGIKRWAVLQLVQQAPKDRADYDRDPPEDFWTRKLLVNEGTIESWSAAAERIASLEDAGHALREFAAVEVPLENLEQPVGRFIDDIERSEQLAWDLARGR